MILCGLSFLRNGFVVKFFMIGFSLFDFFPFFIIDEVLMPQVIEIITRGMVLDIIFMHTRYENPIN